MTTQNTDSLTQAFGETLQELMPLVVAISCLGMAERLTLSFLERDAEKALGRPLTAYDRVLLRNEYGLKQACSWLESLSEVCQRRYRDDEIIRQVVWRRG
jgi:hypothetical protein